MAGLLLSVVAGVLSTVMSGEWRISWAFLLVDIPLVAGCAVIGFLATAISGEWRISWAFLLIDIPLVAGCAALAYLGSRAAVLRTSTGRWTL